MLFGSFDEKDFAIVMLVEELSQSNIEYLYGKFGVSKIPNLSRVCEDEYKVIYVLESLIGLCDIARFLRILGVLEKYIRYKRKGKIYNFSEYRKFLLEMENN